MTNLQPHLTLRSVARSDPVVDVHLAASRASVLARAPTAFPAATPGRIGDRWLSGRVQIAGQDVRGDFKSREAPPADALRWRRWQVLAAAEAAASLFSGPWGSCRSPYWRDAPARPRVVPASHQPGIADGAGSVGTPGVGDDPPGSGVDVSQGRAMVKTGDRTHRRPSEEAGWKSSGTAGIPPAGCTSNTGTRPSRRAVREASADLFRRRRAG